MILIYLLFLFYVFIWFIFLLPLHCKFLKDGLHLQLIFWFRCPIEWMTHCGPQKCVLDKLIIGIVGLISPKKKSLFFFFFCELCCVCCVVLCALCILPFWWVICWRLCMLRVWCVASSLMFSVKCVWSFFGLLCYVLWSGLCECCLYAFCVLHTG